VGRDLILSCHFEPLVLVAVFSLQRGAKPALPLLRRRGKKI